MIGNRIRILIFSSLFHYSFSMQGSTWGQSSFFPILVTLCCWATELVNCASLLPRSPFGTFWKSLTYTNTKFQILDFKVLSLIYHLCKFCSFVLYLRHLTSQRLLALLITNNSQNYTQLWKVAAFSMTLVLLFYSISLKLSRLWTLFGGPRLWSYLKYICWSRYPL